MSDEAVLHTRGSGAARLWRGWIIAVVAVLLAAGGHQAAHSLMHGSVESIPWELFGFSIALTAPVAVILSGRRHSLWSTAATTLFGQAAFHLLYSLPHSGTMAPTTDGHQQHHQPLVLDASAHAAHTAHAATADSIMLAAHLLAAALTTAVVLHGEHSVMTLVAWLMLTPVRLMLAARPIVTIRPESGVPLGRAWIPRPMNVTTTRSPRGPPVLA